MVPPLGVEKSERVSSVLLVFIGLLILTYTVCAWIVGPSMYADQGKGFLALRYWMQGGPFNVYPIPDPADIARDLPYFVAWWSPGQYLAPGLFKAVGFDLGHSMTIVLFLSAVSALVGLYYLYRQWGFPRLSIAVTLLVLATGRLFTHQFDIYGGGEVLITALTPWWLLLLLRMRHYTPIAAAAWVFGAAVVLTVAKLSGLVLVLTSLSAIELVDLLTTRRWRWARWIAMAVALGAFAVLFQLFWLSRGETPTTASFVAVAPQRALTHVVPALVACFTSILSLGDFATAVGARPGHVLFTTTVQTYFVLALPVLAIAFAAARSVSRSHPDYFRFAAALTLIFWLVMAAIFIRGGEVSLEDRHFRQVGMVLAIGVVHAAMQWRRPLMLGAAAFALMLSFYGVASWAFKLRTNVMSAKGDEGFRHMLLTQPELDFIRSRIDTAARGTSLVVVPSAEIQLEFHNRRTFEVAADFMTDEGVKERVRYHGRVDHVGVLMMNKLVANGRAALVLAGFEDYPKDGWKRSEAGDYTYYFQDRETQR